MKFSISNQNTTTLLADFRVDGGFDFHQALVDLPRGSYQLIWEVKLDTSDPIEVERNYRAAIDDIKVVNMTCDQMRKLWRMYEIYIVPIWI